ncbi:MAG: glycoside hydrolase family 127 protein, partial [Saprospiraceae bacterium]|nr:glycoside hydrolase family 127 protein [Saprospiraceae bacterium]
IIKTGQEKDGYLTTWRTIDPAKPPADWVKVIEGKRWESLEMSHELYNAGHLYEAAAVHYRATGKNNFLNIALANADLMVETFGPGKIETVPGHQIIETGLIQLYRITGKENYLKLAKYFLDGRGNHSSGRSSFGPYAQDHLPVTEQDEVVGHAVRAMYMYAGMTDIATIYQDQAYRSAVDALWQNMVNKKIYVTGGIGALHRGESFGDNYELPNLTAYNETCASIGSVYWNHRLFRLTGEVKYYDVIERTLYNGLISGLSLDGEKFFYPNALEADGKYTFNQGSCTRQSWFDCSCCPTNIIRFIPAVPGLIYSRQADTLYVNLYAGSQATVDLNGKNLHISQDTDYPWDGKINIRIETDKRERYTVKLRVPGWARDEVLPGKLYSFADQVKIKPALTINGKPEKVTIRNGYIHLNREWEGAQQITLHFPMSVRKVRANDAVVDDRNKLSLECGPLVYAIEEVDNQNFDAVSITGREKFTVKKQDNLLDGINTIIGRNDRTDFTAIPYYAWSNRGIGKMRVWLPENL